MTKRASRKKRSKLMLILLAPILAIVFLVGWSFYWIGQSRQPKTKQPQKLINENPEKQDNIELIAIPKQEEQILAN
jgi:flagellar basal body-associated protein FliL